MVRKYTVEIFDASSISKATYFVFLIDSLTIVPVMSVQGRISD